MRVGLTLAPRLSVENIARFRGGITRVGPHCPILAKLIAANMRRADAYTAQAQREHFRLLAAHLAGALLAFRTGPAAQADFQAAAREVFELDDSIELLRAAAQRGRGVILMSPHFAAFTFGLPVLSAAVPLSIYFRTPKTPTRRETKERWCAVGGLRPILEPHDHARGGRLAPLVDALRAGQVLYIPPDLPRKRGDGVAVQWLGREIHLPAGAGVLAERTGAPLFLLRAEQRGARIWLSVEEPVAAEHRPAGLSAGEHLRAAVQRHLQWFATNFENWLHSEPALWYSWADKRWTRVLRNDPAYVGPASMPALPTAVSHAQSGAPASRASGVIGA
jgi:lauroyl/myristoyl acyltransferase